MAMPAGASEPQGQLPLAPIVRGQHAGKRYIQVYRPYNIYNYTCIQDATKSALFNRLPHPENFRTVDSVGNELILVLKFIRLSHIKLISYYIIIYIQVKSLKLPSDFVTISARQRHFDIILDLCCCSILFICACSSKTDVVQLKLVYFIFKTPRIFSSEMFYIRLDYLLLQNLIIIIDSFLNLFGSLFYLLYNIYVPQVRPWIDYVVTFAAALIILVCNCIIICMVTRSHKMQAAVSSADETKARGKARHMVAMLVTVSIGFIIMALPLQVYGFKGAYYIQISVGYNVRLGLLPEQLQVKAQCDDIFLTR